MRARGLFVFAFGALAALSVNRAWSAEEDPDAYFAKATAQIQAFDAEKYAREKAAANDFRLVVINQAMGSSSIPGLLCTDFPVEYRGVFSSDVVFGDKDMKYREELRKAAARFNVALATNPAFPSKDICFPVEKKVDTSELAKLASARPRPSIVDLATAIRAQNVAETKRLIASGADPNAEDSWHRTPLVWAARRRNTEITRLLLSAGALSDQSAGYDTPLEIAVESGNAAVVSEILSAEPKGSNPPRTQWNDYSNQPLDAAARLNRTDLIQLLVDFHAVPSPSDGSSWWWSLRIAAENRCLICLRLMLAAAGPDVGKTPEFQELISGQLDKPSSPTLPLIVGAASGAISYSRTQQQALDAAAAGAQSAALKVLLEKGQDANLLTPDEGTALSNAASKGDVAAIEKLLTVAAQRRKAVDAAILSQDVAAIRAALPPGATFEQDRTFTPLMLAAKSANGAIVDVVLELGAKLEAKTSKLSYQPHLEGESALYFALDAVNLATTRALLARGADVDGEDGSVRWPLLTAVGRFFEDTAAPLSRQLELVDLLLEGTKPDQRLRRLNLILAGSAGWKQNDVTRALIKRGAQPCAPINYYALPIVSAAGGADLELFKLLVARCPTWSPKSIEAREALREVLSRINSEFGKEIAKHLPILRYLLDQKTPLPPPNLGGTALMWAAMSGSTEVVGLLLDTGADINEISEYRTALDWAHDDIMIAYLRKRGAKTAEEFGVQFEKVPEGIPF